MTENSPPSANETDTTSPELSIHAFPARGLEVRRTTDVPRGQSLAEGLACSQCGATYPLDERTACDACFGPLHVSYDLSPLVGSRPGALLRGRAPGLFRVCELLPPISTPRVERLRVGPTPLWRATRLAEAWGLDDLWLKDDTVLPTGSFKDRPAAVAVGKAADLGLPVVGCASTGNLAAATARAASRLGLPSVVIVPAGLPESKLRPVLALGGRIVEVEGTYDDANRLAHLLGEERRVGLVNVTLRPYYTEGSKTLALETLDALEWRPPDWIGVPLGSGALLSATFRGLEQVRRLGWFDASEAEGPALFGSQPEGCAPIAEAFARGGGQIVPVREPRTIAESLAIGDPASGYEALSALQSTGGFADAPTSQEVREAILDAARYEGIWVEPAGGTVLATVRRKLEQGVLHRSERIVVLLTGAGWKTPDVLGPLEEWSRPTVRVRPNARDLGDLLAEELGPSRRPTAPARPLPQGKVGPW